MFRMVEEDRRHEENNKGEYNVKDMRAVFREQELDGAT